MLSRRAPAAPPRAWRGLALLESLASMVVLGLGVMALLGTQLRTVAENRTANSRQVAVRLADDLLERLKTNPLGWGAVPLYEVGWGTAPAATTNCGTTACSGQQKAAWDLVQWKANVAAALPGGQATAFVATDPRQLGVMIAWRANERSTDTAYVTPFNVNVGQGNRSFACPADLICHVTYGQPQ